MKEKILSSFITLVMLAIVLVMGFGAYSLYLTMRFQSAYQDNIISAQRDQIEATCEAIQGAKDAEVEEEQQ
jgi:hypothetical protein